MSSFYPKILKCMLEALNSSQPALRKRAVQTVTRFLFFEEAYNTLLAFVKERFDRVFNPSNTEMPNNQRLTVSYFKIALQCLVALA